MPQPSPPLDACRQRHTLIYPRPQAWTRLLENRDGLARHPLLLEWAERGWPLIARRPSAHERDGVAVGLPLPPAAGKARIALIIAVEDIARVAPLPALSQAIGTAPTAWQPHLHTLQRASKDHGVTVQVFGSLAWEHLTGLSYVTDASDLDLAWSAPRRPQFASLLNTIAHTDAASPMRLDGEIVFADGAAANWRELHSNAAHVILKTSSALTLVDRARIAQMLNGI
jgi:phosphoribosyl-dephospho-CoA transferase